VIAQESLGRLINKIYPGAYRSMTKISFSDLDKLLLRPTGVYGSKTEIIKLLTSLGMVDNQLFVSLFIYDNASETNFEHPVRIFLPNLKVAARRVAQD
jgi:hypothetical protein